MINLHLKSDKQPRCGSTVIYRMPDDESLRRKLQEPLGKIIQEPELGDEITRDDICIAVGDESAVTLFKHGFRLKLAIVDYKTQRKACPDLKSQIQKIGVKVIKVVNPPGLITEELWDAISNAFEDPVNVRVEVEGEEDLATIPSVILAPVDCILVYGMPNQGLVVARIDEEKKIMVKNALEMMEMING